MVTKSLGVSGPKSFIKLYTPHGAKLFSLQFCQYFLWRPNPNKSVHLFSFQRGVLYGILSGLLIVLRGVSLCEISPCLKQQRVRKVNLSALASLDSLPGVLHSVLVDNVSDQRRPLYQYLYLSSVKRPSICTINIKTQSKNEEKHVSNFCLHPYSFLMLF